MAGVGHRPEWSILLAAQKDNTTIRGLVCADWRWLPQDRGPADVFELARVLQCCCAGRDVCVLCVCMWERERMCVCVCMWERERERENMCVWEREYISLLQCVWKGRVGEGKSPSLIIMLLWKQNTSPVLHQLIWSVTVSIFHVPEHL